MRMKHSCAPFLVSFLLSSISRARGAIVPRPKDVFAEDLFLKYRLPNDAHTQLNDERQLQQSQQARLPIIEIVAQTFVLQDLEAYLVISRSAYGITGDGPYTFFPPWDEAWPFLGDDMIAKFRDGSRQWSGHLRNLLQYHLFHGEFILETIAEGASVTLTMANGEQATVQRQGENRLRINSIPSIGKYEAEDGIAFMLDRVMLPAWYDRTLAQVISNGEFPTLIRLLTRALLQDDMETQDGITLFAPSEQAFADLGQAVLQFLESPQGLDTLTEILKYHVIQKVIPTMNIPPSGPYTVTSMSGESLTINNGNPVVLKISPNDTTGAAVVKPDTFTNNGVVHVIDKVLLTQSISVSVVDVIASTSELSILSTAIEKAEFANVVGGAGPYLMFAPTDTAFGRMDATLYGFLMNDPGWIPHLQDFLSFHVTSNVLRTDEFSDREIFDMLNGERVYVNNKRFTPSFGFPNDLGTATDLPATNGLVTTISRPLAPFWATQSLYAVAVSQVNKFASFLETTELSPFARSAEANWMVRQ